MTETSVAARPIDRRSSIAATTDRGKTTISNLRNRMADEDVAIEDEDVAKEDEKGQIVSLTIGIKIENVLPKARGARFRFGLPIPKAEKKLGENEETQGEQSEEDLREVETEPVEVWEEGTWEKSAEVFVGETFAVAINENPQLVFTLSTEHNLFSAFIPLDISPLLDGDTECGVEYGRESNGTGLEEFFNGAKFRVRAQTAILTEELCKELNPFSLKLESAKPVPGDSNAQPVYLSCGLFAGFPGGDRNVFTMGLPQGAKKFTWNHKTTVLLGPLDRDAVAEYFQTQTLTVELHDHDVDLVAQTLDESKPSSLAVDETEIATTEDEFPSAKALLNLDPMVQGWHEMVRTKSKSKFETDKIAWGTIREKMMKSSKQQAHGRADFRLDDLWSSSNEIVKKYKRDLQDFSSNSKAVEIRLRSNVVPIKCSISPDVDLVCRLEPGKYLEASTEIAIYASLTHPLHYHENGAFPRGAKFERKAPFERQIYLFEYGNTKLLQTLRSLINQVNRSALSQDISLRSYQLNEREKEMAENEQLDIITGFQVVDDDFRIVAIEGLSAKGMKELNENLGRDHANSQQYKVLSNPSIRFKRRLYTNFEVDLKVIRLRDPLHVIMQTPDIYDRFRVQDSCFRALEYLSAMRNAQRLGHVARLHLFPTVAMLIDLESKYGESVSLLDMDGFQPQKQRRKTKARLMPTTSTGDNNQETHEEDVAKFQQRRQHEKLHRKAPTDSFNPEYVAKLEEWKPRDFLKEHRVQREHAMAKAKLRLLERSMRDERILAEYREKSGQPHAFMYSGQKLNFIEWQKEAMRKRLARNTRATYTYSQKFQSLTFPLVDADALNSRSPLKEDKSKFITPSGFIYPAPRSAEECRKHPKPLSEARIEDLRDPWVQNANHPKPIQRGKGEQGLAEFDCVPSGEYKLFGGYNNDGSRNPDFFQSVHIGGDGLELDLERAKQREIEEWKSKVIVDNIRFATHHTLRANRPTQLDKLRDILREKPRKKAIKIVRNARLPSGKPVPLRRVPVSIFTPTESTN